MSGSVTSDAEQLNQIFCAAIRAEWAGSTPVGTLSLQISDDGDGWSDYTGSATTVNGDGNFLWNLSNIGYQYVRVVYARVSGDGLLNITISFKGV